jgi:membrane protein DedA with SNARE-associated domain
MKTIALLFVACVFAGVAMPMPEDIVIIAAGTTVTDPATFAAFCVTAALGLLVRDSLFFGIGHFAGEGLLRWPRVLRLLGESRISRARQMVEARGGRAVLISRFLIGFRTSGFLVSGALGVRFRDFVLWDAVGLVISVPIVMGLGLAFGGPITAAVEWLLDHRWLALAGLVVVGAVWWLWTRLRAKSDAKQP